MVKKYLEFLKEYYDYEEELTFNEDDYDDMALDYVNQYYSDEDGSAPYGGYEEILNRVNDFCTDDFPYGIQNIPDPLYLYRLLVVNSEDDINKENLGKYYVGDKDMLEDSGFLHSTSIFDITNDDSKWYVVTIKTSSDNLDIRNMLGNRAEYPTEYQFTLLNDNNLNIVNIQEVDVFY